MRTLIFISIVLASCNQNNENAQTELAKTIFYTDSVQFEPFGLQVKFDNQSIFDTSYNIYMSDMCTPMHNAGRRFSNSKFSNEDTIPLKYDNNKDSLLYVTFGMAFADNYDNSILEGLDWRRKYLGVYRMAVGNDPIEPDVSRVALKSGIQYGLLGYVDTLNPSFQSSEFEIFGRLDTIMITGNFSYSGRRPIHYLEVFEKIAKTVVVEKL